MPTDTTPRQPDAAADRIRLWTPPHLIEVLAVFVLGAAMMAFMHAPAGGTSDPGVPGHDSFYHIKMASMIPEYGLVDEFPWLRFCWFGKPVEDPTGHDDAASTPTSEEKEPGDSVEAFVSHHYGFHVLLMPFVTASKAWTGDCLPGGRWAVATFFGLSLSLFHLLLISEGVRWRWLWLIALMLMPSQFFGRHAFVRAISPSLMFMMLILLLMFRRRYILMALAIAAYNHLYFGAVMFSPVIVIVYVISCMVGRDGDRTVPWKLVVFALTGWGVGILTCPYLDGMLDFLMLQVLGSGLSPDISVGREWNSYSPAWFFVRMSGGLLAVWACALALRLRLGPRLTAKELSVLLMSFVFLILTLKARRFIEYWPALCLLSAAMMARPVLGAVASWFERPDERGRPRAAAAPQTIMATGVLVTALATAVVLLLVRGVTADRFFVEWPVWVLAAGLYMVAPFTRAWCDRSSSGNDDLPPAVRVGAVPASVTVFVVLLGLLFLVALRSGGDASARLLSGFSPWVGLAVLNMLATGAALWHYRRCAPRAAVRAPAGAARSHGFEHATPPPAAVLLAGLAVVSLMCLAGARPLMDRQSDIRSEYDLPKIRAAMEFLKEHSEPGDVVFTDDWDIFPVYFYYNSHNHYIVGLDPKFTHHRDPELWDRYVKISRGQVPTTIEVTDIDDDGTETTRREPVNLKDIRQEFGARFVVTDRDHKPLAAKLAAATELTELIYPSSDYKDCRNAPYLIFRISDAKETDTPDDATDTGEAADGADAMIYLSQLTPNSVDQAWGDLSFDHAVGGGALVLGDTIYLRGLGTHAKSRIVFTVPQNYATFAATVGVDARAGGDGSVVVSIILDDETVFTSDVLMGSEDPVDVRILLGDSKQITLIADPTEDGNRFDHTDWAMARFLRQPDGD